MGKVIHDLPNLAHLYGGFHGHGGTPLSLDGFC